MSESKKLTKRQAAVINDLFAGELEEAEVLEKHHVQWRQYERWLADGRFTEQLELRIAHAHRQSRMILAQCAASAAAKLVELTHCEKEETARKACLDIIAPPAPGGQNRQAADDPASDQAATPAAAAGLTPELAGRLLDALARNRQAPADNGSS